MFPSLFRAVCIALLAVLVGACSDNSTNPGDDGNGGDGGITMTLNGSAWTSTAGAAASVTVQNGRIIAIGVSGLRGQTEGITFGAANFAGLTTGTTYVLDDPNTSLSATWTNAAGEFYNTIPGQGFGEMTITGFNETDGHISGTFAFDLTAVDSSTVEVRGGLFERVPATINAP